jgi:hypothetical protein
LGSRLLENYKFPENVESSFAPDGSCEFVGELLFNGSNRRKCQSDGLECFGFLNPEVYASCPTRKEALKKRSHGGFA